MTLVWSVPSLLRAVSDDELQILTSMVNAVSGLLPGKARRETEVFSVKMVHYPLQGSIDRSAGFQRERFDEGTGGDKLDEPTAADPAR